MEQTLFIKTAHQSLPSTPPKITALDVSEANTASNITDDIELVEENVKSSPKRKFPPYMFQNQMFSFNSYKTKNAFASDKLFPIIVTTSPINLMLLVYKTEYDAKRRGRTLVQKLKKFKKTKQTPYTGV